jgi:hypothetical protein
MLLLVVCAALLATPAIVMALMTGLDGNTSPTIQSDKADIADPSANPHGNTSPAIQGEGADIADPNANTLPAQTIQSEEAVYARGKTVTITGSNWQPGESVHISVNDDQGKIWSRNVDVTADASGRIQVQFQLPDWFGATYEVTAMGDQSGVATTSFTEGNVSFRSTSPAPASWTVNYTTHGGENTTNNTSCATGGTQGSKTISPGTTGTASVGISNKESMRLGTVTLPAESTLVFDHWTDQNGNTIGNDACLSGNPSSTNGNITDLIAHFDSAKQAPEAQPQPIVSTDEDTAKSITLSGTDEGGDNLTFFIVSGPSHGTLGPIGALTCAGTAPRTCSANVTYTPDSDYSGFDIFSFKADNGTEGSYPAPVSILVDPVNDTPVATDETKTMSEDGAPLSIDFGALLSDVETSDANLTYDITNPDPAKGSLNGAGPRRNFTPAANFNGTVNIDYTPTDRGDPDKCSAANPPCAASEMSAQKTVTVTVDAVNDAPSFTKGPDQTKDEDAGAQTVDDWATAISAGPNEFDQRVDFQLTNDTNLFTAGGQPAIHASGKLTYEATPNANGSATVTVKPHDDGGIANGGADTSAEQTFTISVSAVNDAPMVSNLQGDGAANEGDVKTYTFDIADVDSSTFSASVDCGGAGKGKFVAESVQISGTNGEFKCKFLDGLISPTPVNIGVQVSDGEKLSNVESKSVSVSDVAPALTGVGSSSQNALAGTLNPVIFTGTATDVSPIDLAAGFSWRWGIDGGAYGPVGVVSDNTFTVGGANNQLYFSTCGVHTVKAQASDKDGGVSAESPQATKSVSVYNGAFSPPLVDGSTNMVQKGQVVPVEISVGCGTTNLTNLTPYIQLLSGNVSPEIESGSTTVTTTSVLAADAGQTMRPVDGGYIYNLQVPSNAAANEEFTILVNPFGATADHAATGMYVVIKIRK